MLRRLRFAPREARERCEGTPFLPLDLAVMRGAAVAVVSALLVAYPAAAQLSKQGGLLALHLAARHGSGAAVLAELLSVYPAV